MFNFFKKEKLIKEEKIIMAELVEQLLAALRDDEITEQEKIELREKAYSVLIDLGLDKMN